MKCPSHKSESALSLLLCPETENAEKTGFEPFVIYPFIFRNTEIAGNAGKVRDLKNIYMKNKNNQKIHNYVCLLSQGFSKWRLLGGSRKIGGKKRN